jgi:uncharacterized protein (DUF924 family)
VDRAAEILGYWFGDWDDDTPVDPKSPRFARWFGGQNPDLDREIRERFEDDHLRAARGDLRAWEESPRGATALVILLDQFPRNMYRGTPHAFATDPLARAVTERALAAGRDQAVPLLYRQFLYLPLMHAEDLGAHERCVTLFAELASLAKERSPGNAGFLASAVDYARRHRDIVARFGRFPHRNAILARTSTPEEAEFLKQPGSSF